MVEGSSVPRRQLGRYLKAARERAGFSLEAAGKRLEWSKAKMYRIEGGQFGTSLRTHDVRIMCGLYEVDARTTEAFVSLVIAAKTPNWWHAYGDVIPAWFELYVGLEEVATRLRHYAPTLVPGLLQTRGYATAVFRARPDLGEDEISKAVELRMARQRLLGRHEPAAPRVEVILDEAALRRPGGSPRDMAEQLIRLAEADSVGVSVRILPTAIGLHLASHTGAFVLLDFAGDEPEITYMEALAGSLYLEKPPEVAAYEAAWAGLSGLALDGSASAGLLRELAKEYDSAA